MIAIDSGDELALHRPEKYHSLLANHTDRSLGIEFAPPLGKYGLMTKTVFPQNPLLNLKRDRITTWPTPRQASPN